MTTTTDSRRRAHQAVVRLVNRSRSMPEFVQAVTRTVGRVVPCEGICLLTLDPATLLPTAAYVENGLSPEAIARLIEIEVREADVNKFTALARQERPAASLSAATDGQLDRSLRHRELRRPCGYDDELRAVLSGVNGTWGALTLRRAAGSPRFTASDVQFVAAVAGDLADDLRRAALLDATAAGDACETGLLILAPDDSVEMANTAADRWLDALAEAGTPTGQLPVVVRAVANRARALAGGESDAKATSARVHTRSGQWLVARASTLGEPPTARIAVLLDLARPPEMAPLIAAAYGFTDRERRVTELIARGCSTNDIAARLHISAYTVQDHLKSIFAKTGASSRGDVVARLFFDHFAPCLTAERPAGATVQPD